MISSKFFIATRSSPENSLEIVHRDVEQTADFLVKDEDMREDGQGTQQRSLEIQS